MAIEIRKPELERMVREELQKGSFDNVDDLLTEALLVLRSQLQRADSSGKSEGHGGSGKRKSLAQLFAESPFRGLDLQVERDRDTGRDITL